MTRTADSALLLFDGSCGFCARSVQFVLRHEGRRRTLRFASLESPTGRAIRARHPELEGVDSVVWYQPATTATGEDVLVRSAAVLRVLDYVGGMWHVASRVGALVPRVALDRVYDFVARHRHELTRDRLNAACVLPTPEQRGRFVDWDS